MFQHFVAGLSAIIFARWLDGHDESKPRSRGALITCFAVTFGMLPLQASAVETIADGSTVRIRSGSIEAGWHTGRIKRDNRRCSMVQLDRPTEHGYTLLALMVVDALQLGRTGQWTAIDAKRAIASEPAHCLTEGSD
jgi:hypothetical protein